MIVTVRYIDQLCIIYSMIAPRNQITEQWVTDHYNELFTRAVVYATPRLGKTDAEDIASITISRAWINRNQYDASRPFLYWFYGILNNAVKDYSRRKHTRKWRLIDEMPPVQDTSVVEPLEQLISDEQETTHRTLVREYIDTLPEYLKEPIIEVGIYQKPYKQVAQNMGIPLGTLKSRINKARRLIAHGLMSSYDKT